MDGKPNEEQGQKIKDELRKALGDQILKGVEAREAQIGNTAKVREARMQKTAKLQEAKAQKFMEAQQLVQPVCNSPTNFRPAPMRITRAKAFCSAADTPIFWYHRKDAKNYRIIYADLSLREAQHAAQRAQCEPVSGPPSPKK